MRLTRQHRLGNPLDAGTNLGPMVRTRATEFARGQVAEAIALMNDSACGLTAAIWTSDADAALSSVGYEQLTRPKSFHLRLKT